MLKRWWGRLLCRWGYHDNGWEEKRDHVEFRCRRCGDTWRMGLEACRERPDAWKPGEDVEHLKRLVERLRKVTNVAVGINRDFTDIWQTDYDLPPGVIRRCDELWFVLREADLSVADLQTDLDQWLLWQRENEIERKEAEREGALSEVG